jgi:hypothetical protein
MKISYSIASTWWQGDIDKALAMLNGENVELDLRTEKAFSYGQGFHKALELESKSTGKLPAIFKLPDFEVIGTEVKLYKELPSGDILSGVIDVVATQAANKMIVLGDYKSGTHFDEMQANVYQVLVKDHPWWLANVGDIDPTHAAFLCLDKASGDTLNNFIHLTYPTTQEEWDLPNATSYTTGYNWIMTIIDDIKNNLGITE